MYFLQSIKTILLSASAAFLTMSFATSTVMAQSFPSKPLTFVVAYQAGGGSDFVARVLAKEMPTTLQQSILVENIVGVAGALGTQKVVSSNPDGYMAALSSTNDLILTPIAYSSAKYKSEELRTAAIIGSTSIMVVTRKDLGVNTLDELIALAKKNVDKPLSYCTPGIGSLYHMMGEKFNAIAKTKTLHVPYNGFPPCVTNVVGGQVDFAFVPLAGPFPGFVDSGNLKILAITSAAPNTRFPAAPITKSIKGFEDFLFSIWVGLHVPVKTPDAVVSVINKAAYAALANPEVKKTIEASGSIVSVPMSLTEMDTFYNKEIQLYRGMAKAMNLQQQ